MDVNNVSIMSEEFRRMRQFVNVLQVCRVTSRVVSSSVYVETMFGVWSYTVSCLMILRWPPDHYLEWEDQMILEVLLVYTHTQTVREYQLW